MHHYAVRTWKSLFFAAFFEYYCCQTIIKIATIWLALYLWGTTNLVFSSEGKTPHNPFWLDNTNLTTTSDHDLTHSKCLAKRFLHLPSPLLSPSSAAFHQPNDGCVLLWWVSTISVILTLLVYCLFLYPWWQEKISFDETSAPLFSKPFFFGSETTDAYSGK